MRSVVVLSLKGGVGKTTCTAELIKALRRKGYRVGGLDVDHRAPNLPFLFGMDNPELLDRAGVDELLAPQTQDGIPIFSLHFIWPPGQAVMVKDDEAMEDIQEIMRPGVVNWGGELDYLLLDTPPDSVGAVMIAFEAPDLLGCIVVCQPSRVSRADAERSISLLREKEVPILGLLVNQAYFEGDHQSPYDLTAQDIREMANKGGVTTVMEIPFSHNLAPYFDKAVQMVLKPKPVILKVEKPQEEAWRQLMRTSRLLNALKSKET